jgi:hypothetical protein
MSSQNLQLTRAIDVVPNDEVNIPYPNQVASGITTGAGSFLLVDAGVDFVSLGIKNGDTVRNVLANTLAIVTSVSQTELGLAQDIFGSGDSYAIYQGSNIGCAIYVGVTGQLSVLTAGNNTVLIDGIPSGSVLPLRVLRVNATGTSASNIIALW